MTNINKKSFKSSIKVWNAKKVALTGENEKILELNEYQSCDENELLMSWRRDKQTLPK